MANIKYLDSNLLDEIAEARSAVYNQGFEAGLKEGVLRTIAVFKTGDLAAISEIIEQPPNLIADIASAPPPMQPSVLAQRSYHRQKRRSSDEIARQLLTLVQEAGRPITIHDFLSRYPTTGKSTAQNAINRLISEKKIKNKGDTYELDDTYNISDAPVEPEIDTRSEMGEK